jgi:2-dehydropantoate 2-reductase
MNGGERPVGVAGAGSIGCFVGGALAAGGRRVALLARQRVIGEIRDNGLRLTNFDGSEQRLPANQFTLSDDPSILDEAGVVLVSVKSADTAEIADILARHAPRDAVIVSLQNGVGNVAVLRERLPGRKVLGGMVPFNVISPGDGRFHRSTSGDIVVEQDDGATAASLSVPGLSIRPTDNIEGVQWGKLIVNLNNALNALATSRCGGGSWRSGNGEDCSPTRWRRAWRRSGRTASSRFRRRRYRPAGCRLCCACPTQSSRSCWGGP